MHYTLARTERRWSEHHFEVTDGRDASMERFLHQDGTLPRLPPALTDTFDAYFTAYWFIVYILFESFDERLHSLHAFRTCEAHFSVCLLRLRDGEATCRLFVLLVFIRSLVQAFILDRMHTRGIPECSSSKKRNVCFVLYLAERSLVDSWLLSKYHGR